MSQTRSEIRRLLDRHGVAPRRRLGQHFLADPNIAAKIASLAGDPLQYRALEIGAGTGALTRALAEAGFAVTAYEIDRRLRPLLSEALAGLEAEVRYADAARLDPADFGRGGSWVLAANLPYQTGTSILLDLLAEAAGVRRCVVMLQREAAERLAARPGSKVYGLPSAAAALYGAVRLEFRVPSQVFLPAPRVESAVVTVERTCPPDPLRKLAFRVAAAGFGRRRKMLRSSLRPVLPPPAEDLIRAAGVDPALRAEDLEADHFLAIASAVQEAGG